MNCIINNVIDTYYKRGKKAEVIRRYIKMKYRISIDTTSIRERIKSLKMDYKFS